MVSILEEAQSQVARFVNSAMVLAYWQIGRELVESRQGGAERAGYGAQMLVSRIAPASSSASRLEVLSARLQERVGRGYSTTNLRYFRTFYKAYADRSPTIRHIGSGEFGGSPSSDSGHGRRKIRHIGSGVLGDLESASWRVTGACSKLVA